MEAINLADIPKVLWDWCSIFNKEQPLSFTGFSFWLFFLAVMVLFSLIHKRKSLRNAFLFGVSLFFYFKTSGLFFLLLLFSTLTDYVLGHAIYRSPKKWQKTLWLSLSVLVNLGSLSYFKYAYFFADAANKIWHPNTPFEVVNWLAVWANQFQETTGWSFSADQIILPVGVSFFTFQTISYAADIYRGQVKPLRSLLDFGFYVSFFPQLVAGPIVRAAEFVPQIHKKFSLTKAAWGMATFMIVNGLVKKLLLADFLALNYVDKVFDMPHMYMGFDVLMGLFVYSLQVYADFSGYTDIAIGVALLMGFRLPDNFNSPYKAKNVAEFWKRWHISLSTWLKDYLYIPLGGNRKSSIGTFFWSLVLSGVAAAISGSWWIMAIFPLLVLLLWLLRLWIPGLWSAFTTNINMLLTMLIGGLWHGASWNFLIWGGLNGLGLLVYKGWRKISPYETSNHPVVHAWKVLFTFVFISFTRLFFRAGDQRNPNDNWETAEALWAQLFNPGGWNLSHIFLVSETYRNAFLVFLGGMVLHWLPKKWKDFLRRSWINLPLPVQALAALLVVFVLYQLIDEEGQTFIYFQF